VYTCEHVKFDEGISFAKQILKEHPEVDGIFAITDLVAAAVLSYFKDNKIKVPEQIAVIGFSNWFISQVLTPKLSTVDQPSNSMGIESFNLLLEEINCHKKRRPFTPKTVVLETKTIIRESSIRIL
jgi:LacI family transcriptional regulator